LITALFAGGGYEKLWTAWRDLLGQRTRVLIPATNVKVSNRCAQFDIALRWRFYKQILNQNAVVWDVASCGFIINRRFGGTCRLFLQGRKINASESVWRLLTDWLATVEEHWMRTLGSGRWAVVTNAAWKPSNPT
jgi:hypothetical protein